MDDRRTILTHLILFGRYLKERGLKVTPDRIVTSARALKWIDLASREDFAAALKTTFVSARKELPIFEEAFQEFWGRKAKEKRLPGAPFAEEEGSEYSPEKRSLFLYQEEEGSTEGGEDQEKKKGGEYSPHEVLMAKDFSQYLPGEREALERELLRLLSQITQRMSRRREPSYKGRELDFRRSFRRALPFGGEFLQLVWRRKKVKPLRVIVLCDVSGSMDASTRFCLQFLFGLQRVFRRSEFFVFSTRLTRITAILRRYRWAEGLAAITGTVKDWSGGTQIGNCLKDFNDRYAPDLTAEPAVVILISDGWDRGDAGLLDGEMKRLRRRAKRLIWMNPLLGTPEYQPLCLGMRTALPYLDYFLPANTLGGLKNLGDLLAALSRETNGR